MRLLTPLLVFLSTVVAERIQVTDEITIHEETLLRLRRLRRRRENGGRPKDQRRPITEANTRQRGGKSKRRRKKRTGKAGKAGKGKRKGKRDDDDDDEPIPSTSPIDVSLEPSVSIETDEPSKGKGSGGKSSKGSTKSRGKGGIPEYLFVESGKSKSSKSGKGYPLAPSSAPSKTTRAPTRAPIPPPTEVPTEAPIQTRDLTAAPTLETEIDPCQNVVCPDGEACFEGVCITDGVLAFRLSWSGFSDVDIHVTTPCGVEISYRDRVDEFTGGNLDIDDINGGSPAIENLVFPDFDRLPFGNYELYINNYSGGSDLWTAEVFIEGMNTDTFMGTDEFRTSIPAGNRDVTCP